MTSTIEQFRQTLLSTGLLREEELNSLLEKLPLDERPLTSEALGEFLVNKHKLTPYQMNQILEEQGEGLVLGKYIVQEVVRRGAMGVVYRARHAQMKRDVALKVILSNLADDPECVARFHREVHLAAKLDHPNIVTAFDASEGNGQLFLVMEYIEGEDLKTIINKRGALALSDAIEYITQAARGLKYAHAQGVIHRDVKPSNLLLSQSGTIKILDVGLAMEECNRNDSDLTVAGGLLGSVNYMAPEQARDARNADARSDIYSLGCTLWYLLAGTFLYEEKTVVNRILAHRDRPVPDLESLGENIPAELQSIFRKMVAKHPDDRYQSMAELLEDLEILQFQLSEPDRESAGAACETDHGWSLHDTDHIRVSSDHHLIDLPDNPPEEYQPDDPTRFGQGSARKRRLQTALVIIGGFALGCLVMLVFQFLEPGGLHNYQDLKTSAFKWFDGETVSESDTPLQPAAPGNVPNHSNNLRASPNDVANSNSSETDGFKDGRPVPAAAPFSPEQARTHQQRWAHFLGTEVEQTNSLGIKMILIPPGTYRMGSNTDDHNKLFRIFPDKLTTISEQFDHEFPQHTVTLTRPYYISAHVVTFAQFQQFVNETGYQVQPATSESWKLLRSRHTTAELYDLPIRHICWNDAAAYCQWLSEKEQRLYRLPTEAEWEFAARAGSQALFGRDLESLYSHEWWRENADEPHPVGSKSASEFGLYDMCGNVREYCQDFYSHYSDQAQTDPLIDTPRAEGERVVRGGDAASNVFEIRPARRRPVSSGAASDISFRIVSPVVLPESEKLQTGSLFTNAE